MVDHINRVQSDAFRVQETKDSTEEEGKKNQQEADDDNDEKDSFNELANRKDWDVIFDNQNLWNRSQEVSIDQIDEVQLVGLNIQTNPALLKLRILLLDGTVIRNAFISVSRGLGLQLKKQQGKRIDYRLLARDNILHLTIPKDEALLDDEITQVTRSPIEKTFSQSMKLFVSRKTWLVKMGIKDPVNKRINNEILGIYVTVLVIVTFFAFVYFVLMSE